MLQAKEMITLVNQFAANIEEKKGNVTEDEVSIEVHYYYIIIISITDYSIQIYST